MSELPENPPMNPGQPSPIIKPRRSNNDNSTDTLAGDGGSTPPLRIKPGHVLHRHPDGHDCLYTDLPAGAPARVVGVVQEDGNVIPPIKPPDLMQPPREYVTGISRDGARVYLPGPEIITGPHTAGDPQLVIAALHVGLDAMRRDRDGWRWACVVASGACVTVIGLLVYVMLTTP